MDIVEYTNDSLADIILYILRGDSDADRLRRMDERILLINELVMKVAEFQGQERAFGGIKDYLKGNWTQIEMIIDRKSHDDTNNRSRNIRASLSKSWFYSELLRVEPNQALKPSPFCGVFQYPDSGQEFAD